MAMVPVGALAALLALLGLLLHPMLAFVHSSWTDQFGAHSHGYLVLALACYFGWRSLRAPSARAPFKPAPSAAIPLVAVLAAAFAAHALFIGPIQTALAPVIIGLCVALCLGWPAALRLAWPLLFLYLAMPVWGPLNPLLQKITTAVSTAMLGLTHIPFYVEGSYIHLASGTFQIASGCSGLNYLIAAVTLAATQCTLHLSNRAARLKLMAAATLAGLCANWLRVSSLVAIGHVTQMRHYLIRVEHFWFGWLLFIVLLAPVMLYGRWLAEHEPPRNAGPTSLPHLSALRWVWGALAVLAVCVAVAAAGFIRSLQVLPADFATALGHRVTPVAQFASGWRPHAAGGGQTTVLRGNLAGLEVYHLEYSTQTREAYVGHPENSVTGEGWEIAGRNLVDAQLGGRPVQAVEYRGQLHNEQRIIWELPAVGGRLVQSRVRRIMAMLGERLVGRQDGEVWALHAACRGDCERAAQDIRAALAADGTQ